MVFGPEGEGSMWLGVNMRGLVLVHVEGSVALGLPSHSKQWLMMFREWLTGKPSDVAEMSVYTYLLYLLFAGRKGSALKFKVKVIFIVQGFGSR